MEQLMERVQACARKVVEEVCRVKAGERVLIITNRVVERPAIAWNNQVLSCDIAQTEVISQALYDACLEAGACPVMVVQPEKTSMDAADSGTTRQDDHGQTFTVTCGYQLYPMTKFVGTIEQKDAA